MQYNNMYVFSDYGPFFYWSMLCIYFKCRISVERLTGNFYQEYKTPAFDISLVPVTCMTRETL